MRVDSSGMTTTGMTPRTPLATFQLDTHRATKPPRKPVARPPRKPAPIVAATEPPTMPGTRPGRSAIAKAMKPERIGTRKPNDAPPMTKSRAAHDVRLRALKFCAMLYWSLGGEAVLDDLDRALLAEGDLGEHEGQGDEDAAGGDERDHVGDTGHQPLADLACRCSHPPRPSRRGHRTRRPPRPPRPPRPCSGRRATRRRALGLRSTSAGPSEMPFLTPTSTIGLPAKRPASLTGQVVGEDHGVGRGDLGRGDRLRAGGALGLDHHRVAGGLGRVLEALRRHVGVGDAGRARRDPDEAEHARSLRRRRAAVAVDAAERAAVPMRRCGRRQPALRAAAGGGSGRGGRLVERDLGADDAHDLGLGRRGGEGGLEVLLHEGAGELGQHLHVRVAATLGGRDEEDEGGRAVLGAPVDAVGRAAEDERGLGDRGAAGVRDADAAGQAGRHGLLALAHVVEEGVEVGAPARGDEALAERPRRLVAVGTGEVEDDLLFGDEGHVGSFREDH